MVVVEHRVAVVVLRIVGAAAVAEVEGGEHHGRRPRLYQQTKQTNNQTKDKHARERPSQIASRDRQSTDRLGLDLIGVR